MRNLRWLTTCAAVGALTLAGSHAAGAKPNTPKLFRGFRHIVVIYQENHSFDNLYGYWGQVGPDTVNGQPNATAQQWTQVRQDNVTPYGCLSQQDVNLTSPPLAVTCTDNGSPAISSDFTNQPFSIEGFIPPSATTCPTPNQFASNGILNGSGLPGGCTRDIVHRFYGEQYNIDGGKQDRYMTGEDATGLTMGYYDTTQLPIYQYLHGAGAPNYVITDNFFQGAFGGSFLNHQWLISAAAPLFANAVNNGGSQDLHSILDTNNMATSEPLYTPTGSVKDSQLTQECGANNTLACGDYAVNTTQPTYQPFSPGTASFKQLPPLTNTNIGDELSAAGVSWAWYGGGWSNASGAVGGPGWTNGYIKGDGCTDPNVNPVAVYPNCPDGAFQFHHQPFNYYVNYAPGTAARKKHLRDEAEFIQRAQEGKLPNVSFIKPLGENNEHPGYSSETNGSSHTVDLINAVLNGPDGRNTLIVITYDEFGGQWDHVSPPGQGNSNGPHDQWGPGTRIPAILISSEFTKSGVDHAEHDTTSIIATLEHIYGLPAMGTRDAQVGDLNSAISVGAPQ